MNKTLRFALILAVLVLVVVAAGSQTVWAGSQPVAPAAAGYASTTFSTSSVGTVIVPADPQKEGENVLGFEGCPRSIRGQATLCGLEANTQVFGQISPKPAGYLSKIVHLSFASGSARLCFAAPNRTEKIYVAVGDGWVALYTYYQNGQACTDVSASGNYVLGR